jgi:hypothetical protein
MVKTDGRPTIAWADPPAVRPEELVLLIEWYEQIAPLLAPKPDTATEALR